MKVVALVSGGKDSCYAMMKCIQYGHEIVALANLMPADDSVDELDSYMYQTVGHQIIVRYAECMGVPLFRRRIQGSTRHQKLSYKMTPGDEVEDMFILLNEVKRQIPCVLAVSSGAIASDYQRLRVESVCSRLGLVSLAYLWKQDQSLLLQEMIKNEIFAITVKVAAMGLDPAKHLGKGLSSLESYLLKLNKSYGINVCGEGGEYETLTLDCPLFINARIVLDEYKVIWQSSDSIAPVGFLHPIAFHLENKAESSPLNDNNNNRTPNQKKMDLLFEVLGDCLQSGEDSTNSLSHSTDLADFGEHNLQISQTRNVNTFSLCCWLQDSHKTSSDLQEDLKAVLKKIESDLDGHGLGWENVLYVHLYIANMSEFSAANETYVKFITHDKCPFGVPSRSTIELPLLQVGLGKAYIEVLVANEQTKKVLHVQSISSWAPSCIGPYSQATLHKDVLYMAGQLGLDPPTMTLCNGGPSAELEQALENSEAVAKCFSASMSTSTVFFVIYCSTNTVTSERDKIQGKLDAMLEKMRPLHSSKGGMSKGLNPILLYVLSPNLPKGASVEVKPVLYVPDNVDEVADGPKLNLPCNQAPSFLGFQNVHWHDSCIQKYIIRRKICAIVLCITSEVAQKICSVSLHVDEITKAQLDIISRFCIYLLDKVLMENAFNWDDIMSLRLYFPTSLNVTLEALSLIFSKTFSELVPGEGPIFNLVPVLGSGSSATSMNDIITCELFAVKT